MIRALFNPLTIMLATVCIQWIVVAQVGSFEVRIPYVALALVVLYTAASPRRLGTVLAYIRQNAIWVLPLFLYLVLLTAILWGSKGQNIAPRQLFYLVGGISFAACIATVRHLGKVLRVGAAVGLLLFVSTVEVLARHIGLSWLDAIVEFFRSGNLDFVMYDFLRAVFNSQAPSYDLTYSSSLKNDVAICLLVLALAYRSGSPSGQRDIAGMVFMGCSAVLLVMLNTRSVLIAAAGSVFLASVLGSRMRPVKNIVPLLIKMAGVAAVVTLAVGMTGPDLALSETLNDRFSFDDGSTAGRIEMYQVAWLRIGAHPLAGSGYYEVNNAPIHNLFLGAWMHAGVAAFLLVVVAYLCIVLFWTRFVVMLVKSPERWVLPLSAEWIAPLPIMPLIRVWLSGDAGHFTLGEWIAMSAFFGCSLANTLRRQRMARARRKNITQHSIETRYHRILLGPADLVRILD